MRKLIAIIIFSLITSNSYAQLANGAISVRGSGQFTCGEYVKWSDIGNQGQLDVINQWVWGYLVAYQMRGAFSKTYSIPANGNITSPDAATVELYLKKYCSNNPLSNVHSGVIAMVKELGGIIAGK